MILIWKGQEVYDQVQRAAEVALDRTLAETAAQAKREHSWVSKTGFLEATIGVVEFAHTVGHVVKGTVGAMANYALFVEIGTSRVGRTAVQRTVESAGWWTIPGPSPPPGVRVTQSFTILPPGNGFGWSTVHRRSTGIGPLKAARSYIRPAGYVQFPLLGLRMAAALKGEAMI